MTNDPLTAQEFEELRRNDPWTTGRLIVLAFATLAASFVVLWLISP